MDDSAIEVEGFCSFPAEVDGYNGVRLTKSEMETKLTEMVDQPILEEHSGKQIGKVKGGMIEDGQIKAFIEVSRDNIEGIKAISKLRDGTLKGLSLGIEYLFDMGKEKKVVAKNMKELSLTTNPDCPTALIKNVGPDSELWVAKTNFWTKKLKNEKLENELYKSIEVLREVSESRKRRAKMTDAAPEGNQAEEAKPAEGASEQAANLNEKSKTLEEKNHFLEDELFKIHELFGGSDEMKAIVKLHQLLGGPDEIKAVVEEQTKQKEKKREEMIKQTKIAEDYITMLAEKESDKTELVKNAREQLEKDQGGTFLRVLGLAKARHENSQSNIEKAFQDSKSKEQKERELREEKRRKWSEQYWSKPKEKEERPTKKQKISEEKSFENRWSLGKPPPGMRSKVFDPNVRGARAHFTEQEYISVFE